MFKHVYLTYEQKGCKTLDYGYVLKIDNTFDLINYMLLDQTAKAGFQDFWKFISKYGVEKYSHMSNMTAIATAMTAEMRGISYVDAMCNIQETKYQNMAKMLNEFGVVYIQYCGSYMFKKEGNIERDEIESDSVVYLKKVLKSDIKISQFEGGKHFYARIKGQDVDFKDTNKWNTFEGAENAVKAFIKEKHLEVES